MAKAKKAIKKRVFSKEHLAALRAAHAKRKGKKRGRKPKVANEKVFAEAAQEVFNNVRSQEIDFKPVVSSDHRLPTLHEMAMDVVFSDNDQEVKFLALKILKDRSNN